MQSGGPRRRWTGRTKDSSGPGDPRLVNQQPTPAFEPIYKDIAAHNRTLVAHLAEPDSCWQPPNSASPDYEYYKDHPDDYDYAHPEWPSKAASLAARDHLATENPALRVVGAPGQHGIRYDQIAQRSDRFPNFAVDMAWRPVSRTSCFSRVTMFGLS